MHSSLAPRQDDFMLCSLYLCVNPRTVFNSGRNVKCHRCVTCFTAMRSEVYALSGAALLFMMLMFAIRCCRRLQRDKIRQRQQKRPSTQDNCSETIQRDTDCMSPPSLVCTDCQCSMSQCKCTIILYRPTANNKRQTATFQHANSTQPQTCLCRKQHND